MKGSREGAAYNKRGEDESSCLRSTAGGHPREGIWTLDDLGLGSEGDSQNEG